MPKFVVEREMPGVGSLGPGEIKGASQKSNETLSGMGPQIQWVTSYVTADKLYCVYIAPDEETIREHSKRSGFPANKINRVSRCIDPTSAEG